MKSCCILILAGLFCGWAPGLSPAADSNAWTKAEATLAAHLKQVDPTMHYGEYKSRLLRKYFPNSRLFVRYDRHLSTETRLYFLNAQGEITPIHDEQWRGEAAARYLKVPSVADHLRSLKIPVKTSDDAVEVTKLFEEIQGASHYLAFLWINTSQFQSFDREFMEQQYGPRVHWQYQAASATNGWTVKVQYVGPPANVMQPPTYALEVDGQQLFKDVRREHRPHPFANPVKTR